MLDPKKQNGKNEAPPRTEEARRAHDGLRILAARIADCDRTDFGRMMDLQVKYAALDGFARGLAYAYSTTA